MDKISENVLSGRYSRDTCEHMIRAIAGVRGESSTAFRLFHIVTEELYPKLTVENGLDSILILTLIKMTYKAPILLNATLKFLLEIECFEGIEMISKKFEIIQLSDEILEKMLDVYKD